jgi:hypothetical protein
MTRTTNRSTTRTASGRFAIGNPGGPGRMKRTTEGAYLGTMMEVVSLETWKNIVTSAVEAAQAGDHKAREWIGRYLVGEPTTTAPSPLQVVVDSLLARDAALDKAAAILAEPVIDAERHPIDFGTISRDRKAEILAEAREVLRQSEEAAS